MRRLLVSSVVSVLLLAIGLGAAPRWPWSVKGTLTANPTSIKIGEKSVLTWNCSQPTRSATLDGELVELSGSKEVSPTETTNYTLTANGRRLSMSTMATVTVITDDVPDPTPDPVPPMPDPTPPTPNPVDGFSLSAVGIGSQFAADDALSAASRDHELGAFLTSQNGTWTLITDEVMAANHPAAFDLWVKELEKSGKQKPAVIWHDQGKILSIDEVAGKSKADILQLAIRRVPATNDYVIVNSRVRLLGLKPAKKDAKYTGLRVSAILKPLAAADCPTVDLISQVPYRKNQTGGTCVLNAFSAACEGAIHVSYGKSNLLELSPYFLANLTDGYNGTWAETAANMIQKYGNLPFGDMAPYDRLPGGWKDRSANYKCLAVYGPPDSDSQGYIRAALNRGYVVCAGIGVGSGFDVDSSGYISYARGGSRSVNHEILVVGWDREKSRYKILNSWGKSWGNDGTAWLEDRFFNADTDLWVVVTMTAAPTYKFYVPSQPAKAVTLSVPIYAAIEASKTIPPGNSVDVKSADKKSVDKSPSGSACSNGDCPAFRRLKIFK